LAATDDPSKESQERPQPRHLMVLEGLAAFLPPTSYVGRIARWPLGLIPATAVLRVLSGPLRGARWIAGAGTFGVWLGVYERAKAIEFTKHVGAGALVFDVGAHAGYYTLLAARAVGRSGKVVAFEPNERNVAFLRGHVVLNRLDNVDVVDAAVGMTEGRSRFDVQTADGHQGRLSESGSVEVEVVSLDAIVAKTGRLPDVVKIDVEGGEGAVLRGAATTLKIGHPMIFLATHGADIHAECCEFLRSHGYTLGPLDAELVEEATEIIATKR